MSGARVSSLDVFNVLVTASPKELAADATPVQVAAAVSVNETARLDALRFGPLILGGVSALAIVPASRLPRDRPGELPESVATGPVPDET